MAAFGDGWWDRRTVGPGGAVAVEDGAPVHTTKGFWRYFRLMDDVLQRHYRRVGVEPGLSVAGMELYQSIYWNPSCDSQPYTLGRFCGKHVHPDMDFPPRLPRRPEWPEQQVVGGEGIYPSWAAFRQSMMAGLGLRSFYEPGHEGCFHRRGNAVTPEMFRVALLLRTNLGKGQPTLHTPTGKSLASFPWGASRPDDPWERWLKALLTSDQDVADRPQGYLLRKGARPLVFLRANGQAYLAYDEGEPWDAVGFLRAGADVEETAKQIQMRFKLPNSDDAPAGDGGSSTTITPLAAAQSLPFPEDVVWTDAEWETLCSGVAAADGQGRWRIHAASMGRIYIIRDATGVTIYEVSARREHKGWVVSDALVCADPRVHQPWSLNMEGARLADLLQQALTPDELF